MEPLPENGHHIKAAQLDNERVLVLGGWRGAVNTKINVYSRASKGKILKEENFS